MKKINSNTVNLISHFKTLAFSLLSLFYLFPLICQAAVITVPGDYPTIQSAIDGAVHGDEIIVSPGTYYETANFNGKNIILRSTDPTIPSVVASTIIVGINKRGVIFSGTELTTCVLSGFTITGGGGSQAGTAYGIFGNRTLATIEYNTITSNTSVNIWGGYASAYGIYSCDGIIRYNTIANNWAASVMGSMGTAYGGGVYGCGGNIHDNVIAHNSFYADTVWPGRGGSYGGGLVGGRGTIENNVISNNYPAGLSGCGGSTIQNNTIYENSKGISGCDGIIQNNIIYENRGSGLYNCDGIIQNNIISGNSAEFGGGLYGCDGIIQNNIISHNSATGEPGTTGGGLRSCNGIIQNNIIYDNTADYSGGGLASCNGTIRNCIIWQNSAPIGAQAQLDNYCATPSYSCIQDWVGDESGNISDNPQLADPVNSDFHLLPNSPCIDAGGTVTLTQDFEGDPRPYDAVTWESRGDGSDFDIGPDEFIGAAVPTPIPTPTPTPCVIMVPGDYPTIQAAIDAARHGCEIIVSPGVYYENIYFHGKSIILRSTDPTSPTIVASTIIDGNQAGSVVTFSGTEYRTCMLSGFTITNGRTYMGGGILGNGTTATIENNNITSNTADVGYAGGGGLYNCDGTIQYNTISGNLADGSGGGLVWCNGTIQHNTISGNSADDGGGLSQCGGTINNNRISANLATAGGGGLSWCLGTIQNNVISGNSAGFGGGLDNCWATIQNNTIYGNVASYSGGGLYDCTRWSMIRNCIIWQNTANSGGAQFDDCNTPSYSCIQDWTGGGTGNISDNPQLVDPANGDFHLLPSSPCIDAGGTVTLTQDFEGNPRPWDGTSETRGDGSDYDIGADEYYIPTTHITEYTFDLSVEGWSFLPISSLYFSAASSSYTGGRIGISSANDPTSRLGMWIGPVDIPYMAGNVYRARFVVSSSQATASQNPQFRMRWVQDESLESATQVVNASGTYSNSLPTDPTTSTYSCYFAPIVSGNLGVAFDMIDFDVNQYGTHYVDSVTVERFPFPTLGTLVETYDSAGDFSNWGFATTFSFGPVTSGGAGTGTLTLSSSLANSSNYGWWQSSGNANELTYVADKLYRATFTLRCATDAARNIMPQVRLRCQNEDDQMTQTMELNGQIIGPGAMPEVSGTDYDVYFETPTLPGSPTTGQDGFFVAIDMLDFGSFSGKGGTIYMDSVAIDYLAIP